jgi:cyclopropane fatty-acyl-phospholipid synthase-like methyltransferase
MDKVKHNTEVYNAYVQPYITRFMDLALYKESFNYLVENLPSNAEVFELGCGPGNVIRYLSSKRPDIKFIGIDLAPAMIEAAQKENPEQKFYILDIRDIEVIANRFDGIISAFSIPYLLHSDLGKMFTNCRKLLKPNGLLYLSCMEGPENRSGTEKTSFSGEFKMYISYYTRQYIKEIIDKHGFELKEFLTQDYPEQDGSLTTDMIFIARKTSDSFSHKQF